MATAFKKISKKVEAAISESEENNSDSEESVKELQAESGSDQEEAKEEAVE